MTGHTSELSALVFSPGGGQLATASADGAVRLSDPATSTETAVRSRTVGVGVSGRAPQDPPAVADLVGGLRYDRGDAARTDRLLTRLQTAGGRRR